MKRYEALDDLLGPLNLYCGLVYARNTIDPGRGKVYGDFRRRIPRPR